MAKDKPSFRDRLSGRVSDNKASTKTTATRVTHEKEEAATKVDQKVETAQPSDSVGGPAMPPPTYSVGAGAPPAEQAKLRATMENDRKEAKAKARREGKQ